MIIPKNLEELAGYVGVQTASLSIPLCLILRLPIQI